MEAMRQSWTDDRLDDLSQRMDERFDRVEGEIKSQAEELWVGIHSQGKELRAEIKDQGMELRAEMVGVESRLCAQPSEHHASIGEEFAKVRGELGRAHEDKQQILAGIQALQRTVIQVGWTGAFTLIAAIAGVLVARLL
jgi:chromosome segregation ATPase